MITSLFHSCMSVLFPPRCMSCGKQGEAFCSQCLAQARRALNTPRLYIFSLFDFKEKSIRRAIHAIKYYHRRDLVPPLVHAVALEFKKTNGQLLKTNDWVLVPIPMPTTRKLLRGYNQAELIARALGKELSLPVRTDILTRTRSPMRQVRTSSRNERARNQKGSFTLLQNPSEIHVILVDDVTTTGATLEEARNLLLSQKAADVLAVTLAH